MKYKTIRETVEALKSGETSSVALVKESKETFEADKNSALPLNAFLEIYDDILKSAEAADQKISEARSSGSLEKLFDEQPLLGIPFAVKDNISVRGKKLTCSSKILEGYVAPYSATVINRLEKAGAIPIGRCNQDEFAMALQLNIQFTGLQEILLTALMFLEVLPVVLLLRLLRIRLCLLLALKLAVLSVFLQATAESTVLRQLMVF